MTKKREKRGLGRGLSALMADVGSVTPPTAQSNETGGANTDISPVLPIEKLVANSNQPRQDFHEEDLRELADSIAEKGIIQPIIVRPDPLHAGMYQIVAGERRWRAAQLAQMHEVPAIVRHMDDTEMLEVAIIENIQRSDLNPVEEALAFKQLMESFDHTQEQLAKGLGKSRSHIANTLRLLNLPPDVLSFVRAGKLSSGHARALVSTPNPAELAAIIVSKGLSVREAERLVKKNEQNSGVARVRRAASHAIKDADTIVLESDLAANLKMNVSIDHNNDNRSGSITISYKTLEQLDALCQILSSRPLDGSK